MKLKFLAFAATSALAASQAPVCSSHGTAAVVPAKTATSADDGKAEILVEMLVPDGWVSDRFVQYSNFFVEGTPSLSSDDVRRALIMKPPIGFSARASASQKFPLSKIDDMDPEQISLITEFRCMQVSQRRYQRGQRFITAELFAFPTSDEAYAAYTLLRQGATTVIKRGGASSEHDQAISFWKNNYFVRVFATSEDDDESKGVVKALADQLVAAMPGEPVQPPAILTRIPYMDRVRGSERLVMGPISARRFFPAPYIGSVSFNNASAAAVADYQLQAPYPERLKLLCIDYKDQRAALNAYDGYISAMHDTKRADRAETPSAGGGSISGSNALFKLNGTYLFCCVSNGRLSVISGARRKQSPTAFSRYLY